MGELTGNFYPHIQEKRMHAERKSYKCQREKILNQQNTEIAGVTQIFKKKEKFPSYIFSLVARFRQSYFIFKCWRKRKINFDARSQQAFSTFKFWRKKRRKMSKLNIFTCRQVPASLVYLQIAIRILPTAVRGGAESFRGSHTGCGKSGFFLQALNLPPWCTS